MSIPAKKTKTPQKTQKNNNLLKIKRILNTLKSQLKGAQFLHLAFQGGSSPLAPRHLRHW